MSEIKDSGQRQDFDTGSQRDTQEGKGRFDLLPAYAIGEVAKHFEAGATKYAERNWELGQPVSRFLNSALRHIFKWLAGMQDERHDRAAAWNILAAMEVSYRARVGILPEELNDLPPQSWFEGEAGMGAGAVLAVAQDNWADYSEKIRTQTEELRKTQATYSKPSADNVPGN